MRQAKNAAVMRGWSLTAALLAAFVACTLACGGGEPEEPPAEEVDTGPEPEAAGAGSILRLDRRLDSLIPPGTQIEKLAEGYVFTEGPVWIRGESRLLFSDVRANAIHQWTAADGASPFIDPVFEGDREGLRSISSNGLTIDTEGRLVICEHGNRRISRVEADGSRTVLVDSYEGNRLNSPNDATFGSDGSLYFTDPPYGLEGLEESPLRRARLQRHLPPASGRRARAARARPDAPERHRALARRVDPLRRQLRRGQQGLDGVRHRRERRVERARVLRRQRSGRSRRRRRPEGRPAREPLRHGTGRRLGLRVGRRPPRDHPDAGGDGQRGLGRRRADPVHDGEHGDLSHRAGHGRPDSAEPGRGHGDEPRQRHDGAVPERGTDLGPELPAVRLQRLLRGHDLPPRAARLHGAGRRPAVRSRPEDLARADRQRGHQRAQQPARHGRHGAARRRRQRHVAVLRQPRRQPGQPRSPRDLPAGIRLRGVRAALPREWTSWTPSPR